MNITTQSRIVFLDYLRIFAFINVIIAHKFYDTFNLYISEHISHNITKNVILFFLNAFHGGGAGVVVFFFVSGYIISSVLKSENAGIFAIKRFFRIYPLYAFAVLSQLSLEYYTTSHIPSTMVIVQQLLLVGDFFNTPYALWGVEWTLRVEVMFYIYMGLIKKSGIYDSHKKNLPIVYIATTVLISILSPLPSAQGWSQGTFSIYSPLLFLGSLFYLYETKSINIIITATCSSVIVAFHYYLMNLYTPQWTSSHFAAIAICVFVLSWRVRFKLPITIPVLFLSDLTYSVYLFHNWPWDSIKELYKHYSIALLHPDIQALVTVFFISYCTLKLIEKPFIKIGANISRKFKKIDDVPSS